MRSKPLYRPCPECGMALGTNTKDGRLPLHACTRELVIRGLRSKVRRLQRQLRERTRA